MKTIWKFPLQMTDRQQIEMPKRAEILTVQIQGSQLCLWAVVNVGEEFQLKEKRTIDIYGTGSPLPEIDLLVESRKYIGTVQDSFLVWHVFEIV